MKNLSILFSIVCFLALFTSCQKNQSVEKSIDTARQQEIIDKKVNSDDPAELPAIETENEERITEVKEFLKDITIPSDEEDEEIAASTEAESRSSNYFYENFQSYYLGDISNQSYRWSKWNPYSYFDGKVYRTGGNQYMGIKRKSGYANHHQPDVICHFGEKRYNTYEVSFYMWIPYYKSGYFNIQKNLTYGNRNNEFGAQVYFYGNETGKVKVGGRSRSFHYNQSQWMKVKLVVNLDRNLTTMYINGYYIHSWNCTDTATGRYGRRQIEGLDFYPYASNSEFYIDGLEFTRIYY